MLARVTDNGEDDAVEAEVEAGGGLQAAQGAAEAANMIEMKSIIELLAREKDTLERAVEDLTRANETLRLEQETRKEDVTYYLLITHTILLTTHVQPKSLKTPTHTCTHTYTYTHTLYIIHYTHTRSSNKTCRRTATAARL